MAFIANPPDGFHQEQWQDYFVADHRYHKMRTPSVFQSGGTDLGATPGNTWSMDGGSYVVYSPSEEKRVAQWMIRIRTALATDHDQECIGLQINQNGAWMDFSAKNVNFRNADGSTNWGGGGQQMRDWYDNKPFDRNIWLHDHKDPNRGPKASTTTFIDITLLKIWSEWTMMSWKTFQRASSDEPIWTRAKCQIKTDINEIQEICLSTSAGSYKSGRTTLEFY